MSLKIKVIISENKVAVTVQGMCCHTTIYEETFVTWEIKIYALNLKHITMFGIISSFRLVCFPIYGRFDCCIKRICKATKFCSLVFTKLRYFMSWNNTRITANSFLELLTKVFPAFVIVFLGTSSLLLILVFSV